MSKMNGFGVAFESEGDFYGMEGAIQEMQSATCGAIFDGRGELIVVTNDERCSLEDFISEYGRMYGESYAPSKKEVVKTHNVTGDVTATSKMDEIVAKYKNEITAAGDIRLKD